MDAVLKLHNPAVEAVEKDRQATDFRNREAHEQAEYNRTMQERRDVIAAKVTERLEGRAIVTAEGSGIRITFPDGFVLPILLEDNCESYSLHTTAMVFSADEQPFDYGDEPPSPKPSSMYF